MMPGGFLLLTGSEASGAEAPPAPPPSPQVLGGGGKVRREWVDLYTKKPKRRTVPLVKVSVVLPEIVPDAGITVGIQNPRPVAVAASFPMIALPGIMLYATIERPGALIDRLLTEQEEMFAVLGADDE